MSRKQVSNLIFYIFAGLLALVFLFPMFVMLSKSFMSYVEVRELPVRFFPATMHFENYAEVLNIKYLRMFLNTMIVVLINMIVSPLTSVFCGFGFARMKFKLKKFIFGMIMITVMLPGIVTQIPTYILFAKLNMLNSLTPLWISAFFGGGAINIFLVIQFMRTIPKDIDNAAIIDGASYFRIFYQIVLPLCSPIVIYMAVSIFTACWNDAQGPLIYLSSAHSSKYTLSLGFFFDFGKGGSLELYKNLQMALGVLMTIPPTLVFLFFQKYLLDGVVMTSVKG